MTSLVTWENTLWTWGFIIMVRKMFSFLYKFWRWLLSFFKLSGSEEKCYQFWVNCYTQISLRRMWISHSARLIYAGQYLFQSKHTLIKMKLLQWFYCLSLTCVCSAHFLWWFKQNFSHDFSVTALNSQWLYRTDPLYTYLYNSLPWKAWRAS